MPISDKLKKLYADAAESRIFVKEFPAEGDQFMAFAGRIDKLENAGFSKEKRNNMDYMMCSLYMAAGGGSSREDAVEDAIHMSRQSDGWVTTAR